jgi:hypothetical protein
MDSWAFSAELVWLPLIGEGETILKIFCSSDLWQIYRTLYLFFGIQGCGFTTPSQEAGIQVYNSFSRCKNAVVFMRNEILICLRSLDPTNPPSETSTQMLLGKGAMTHLVASCWQWSMGRKIGVVLLVSGVDLCSLQGPRIEWNGGLMHRQR